VTRRSLARPADVQLARNKEKQKSALSGRRLLALLVFVGVVVLAVANSGQNKNDSGAGPEHVNSCKDDWHKCSDNSDLVNNYGEIARAQIECKYEANDRAKFGTPTWPWLVFGTFHKGDNYVKDGKAILVEKDAQFQNGFGAMVHSTVTCTYDLNGQKVMDVFIVPN
jgi:hypothetical protein